MAMSQRPAVPTAVSPTTRRSDSRRAFELNFVAQVFPTPFVGGPDAFGSATNLAVLARSQRCGIDSPI